MSVTFSTKNYEDGVTVQVLDAVGNGLGFHVTQGEVKIHTGPHGVVMTRSEYQDLLRRVEAEMRTQPWLAR